MTDPVYHLSGIVNRPVIRPQLDNRQTEGALFFRLFRRDFRDPFPQIGFLKAMFINSADKSERISGGFQIDRLSARLNQRGVIGGFMVVSVKENQIPRGD